MTSSHRVCVSCTLCLVCVCAIFMVTSLVCVLVSSSHTCVCMCVGAVRGFYRVGALEVCNFCSHLHDIMTDELIISKFHWMSHMSAAAPLALCCAAGGAERIRSVSDQRHKKAFVFLFFLLPMDDNKLPVAPSSAASRRHKSSFISGTDRGRGRRERGAESRYSAAAVSSPLLSGRISQRNCKRRSLGEKQPPWLA